MRKIYFFIILAFSIQSSFGYNPRIVKLYNGLETDGFTDFEVLKLYQEILKEDQLNRHNEELLFSAALNPYAPTSSHAGNKFYEALAWYHDITSGNKNGKLSISELDNVLNEKAKVYLTQMIRSVPNDERISSWKMLQKLTLLKNEIKRSNKNYFKYRSKKLSSIDYANKWNKENTITSRADFQKRVIEGSWKKPVLIKFGLTYCVHCLLMENLGSVPAVARKYKNSLQTYKLWWNPKNNAEYGELNDIAREEGITSSPIFNLYVNGRLIKSGYAFPDENGNGMENFLRNSIR